MNSRSLRNSRLHHRSLVGRIFYRVIPFFSHSSKKKKKGESEKRDKSGFAHLLSKVPIWSCFICCLSPLFFFFPFPLPYPLFVPSLFASLPQKHSINRASSKKLRWHAYPSPQVLLCTSRTAAVRLPSTPRAKEQQHNAQKARHSWRRKHKIQGKK